MSENKNRPHPQGCDCASCVPTIPTKDMSTPTIPSTPPVPITPTTPIKAMTKAEAKNFEPTKPVGIFLFVFGLVVLGAAFLPMDFSDKMINAVSGLVLIACGAFAYAIGWFRNRRRARM
jgi:hypothetical protein